MRNKPNYRKVVEDDLGFHPAYFKECQQEISRRLQEGRASLGRQGGDIYGINLLIGTAGSVLLNAHHTYGKAIREGTTSESLHAAMLYYLVKKIPDPEIRPQMSHRPTAWSGVKHRFGEINWLVGEKGMAALDIPHSSTRPKAVPHPTAAVLSSHA
jgi:hypothetical protein